MHTSNLPDLVELPPETVPDIPGFYGSDGVFIKPMVLKFAGIMVAQHSHKYAHTSYIATGAIRVWKNGEWIGDFRAPYGIEIPAEIMHEFLSLEDNTQVLCIHNVSRTGDVEVLERNALPFVKEV